MLRKAFTLVEMVFVVAVIGILMAVAIPKFSATRDDASITRAKGTLASLRSALTQEVQKRMMEGNYTQISNLGGTINSYDSKIFEYFDGDSNNSRVLEYPLLSCKNASARTCWMRTASNTYDYKFPNAIGGIVTITLTNNRLNCTPDEKCRLLER